MSTVQVTRQNHYVPVWYQKGFIVGSGLKLSLLDLDPPKTTLPDGSVVVGRQPRHFSPKRCFRELDLYTTRFGPYVNDEVERFLFGTIDTTGATAVRAFAKNDQRAIHSGFQAFFEYLDAQKLRTPKGLDWIKGRYPNLDQLDLMLEMQHLRRMHCTMWFECVREVVSAEKSDVKFIVTDHPVTIYNAACPPTSSATRYPEEPSIALNGTHTIFALNADHCLILTNVAYAKDPQGVDPLAPRPNARFGGQTITRTDALIRERTLSRDEVIAINTLLKSRSRRYVAASKEVWLYPEESALCSWEDIGKVLLPPADSLWHFGGEIYVGYKDGTTQYQDEFGRTDTSHKFLKKKEVAKDLAPNDMCGCGSGRKYRRCCSGVLAENRPPWDVYSIRDRNKILCNAVVDILDLNKGKTWDDVRRELTNEQVKRIHEIVEMMWPKDTNIADLLPRPDRRVFRTVYVGIVDPRTIAASVIASLAHFDEVIVLNPFPNPTYMNAQYSPTKSPGQHKSQLLKNVSVLLTLEPFIDAGIVHLVPDPMEFNASFRSAIMATVSERAAKWKPTKEEVRQAEALAKDDFKRVNLRLPEETLRRRVRESQPSITDEMLERTIKYMKELLVADPFALLQPLHTGEDGGELQQFRGISIELALFLAHLTGSAIITDEPASWRQLQEHTSASKSEPRPEWTPLADQVKAAVFESEINPLINLEARTFGKLGRIRSVFRDIWNTALTKRDDPQVKELLARLSDRLEKAGVRASLEWKTCGSTAAPSARFQRRMALSIPSAGFDMNSVRRLLITFGRHNHIASVPLAIFLEVHVANAEAALK